MAKLNKEELVTLFVLHEKGESHASIATLLGVTEGTVRYHVRRKAVTMACFIDDIRFADEDRAFVSSVRSHDVDSPEALLHAIRSDANELYDKSHRWMTGQDARGRYREFSPSIVKGRSLIVAIPSNHSEWLHKISHGVRVLSDSTDEIISVVPVKGWTSKK